MRYNLYRYFGNSIRRKALKNNRPKQTKTTENLLNLCIKAMCVQSPEESLQRVVEFLYSQLLSDRVVLYETEEDRFYLSCFSGKPISESAAKNLETILSSPKALIWENFFIRRESVIVDHLEKIKTTHPEEYSLAKSIGIRSLILTPLYEQDEFLGFLGVINPTTPFLDETDSFLNILSQFISATLKKRKLGERLNFLSFHDPLTGALNRNALNRDLNAFSAILPHGVIYADICCLKKINDTKGHKFGDRLLKSAFETLKKNCGSGSVYRVGGDEFIVLYPGYSKTAFDAELTTLQKALTRKHSLSLAVGASWQKTAAVTPSQMIEKAEADMYLDKHNIYCNLSQKARLPNRNSLPALSDQSEFSDFIRNYYFDPEILIHAVSNQEKPYYIYFGDLKENVFFISDRMKNDFCFESNIVKDLIHRWGDLVADQDKESYYNDINAIFQQKKQSHNLCYQIRNADRKLIWVHCQGIIKWENGNPLFFSGIVTNLQEEQNIDPVTGLWGPTSLIQQLEILAKTGGWIIGIGLNDFSSINNSIGRSEGNLILRNIAQIFQIKLGSSFRFYRIDNIKFVAVSRNSDPIRFSDITEKIKNITETIYSAHHLFMRNPCSVGFLRIPKDYPVDEEIVQTLSNLINQAKDRQKEAFVTLSEEILNEKQKRAQMLISLNKSVSDGFSDFFVEIQPVTDKTKKNIIAGEVLLRWKKNGKTISPGEFVPILENHHLIQPVGNWVFEQTVRYCKQMTQINPDFHLSVNISYLQLPDLSFFDFIMETVKKYDVNPSSLVIELTETVNRESNELLFDFIKRIKKEGFLFAIDDLGSGYSSLNFLFECPADIVKLDRTLTRKLIGSVLNYRLFKTIIFGCHESSKKICIEGIETEEEMKLIDEMDFDYLQGFYLYRPISPESLFCLLKQQAEEKS